MPNDFISDDDRELFRRAVQNIKPLAKEEQIIKENNAFFVDNAILPISQIYLSDSLQETVGSDDILSFNPCGLSKQRISELKKGNIPWQDVLDLHGFRPEVAKLKLITFIFKQVKAGRYCCLIIHGKGSLRGEPPVLKNLVYNWLQQLPLILALQTASPKDGGGGALYVLLKRIRKK